MFFITVRKESRQSICKGLNENINVVTPLLKVPPFQKNRVTFSFRSLMFSKGERDPYLNKLHPHRLLQRLLQSQILLLPISQSQSIKRVSRPKSTLFHHIRAKLIAQDEERQHLQIELLMPLYRYSSHASQRTNCL